jgi:hypothetical protein
LSDDSGRDTDTIGKVPSNVVQPEHLPRKNKFRVLYTIPGTGKGFELAATLLGEFRQKGRLFELNLS